MSLIDRVRNPVGRPPGSGPGPIPPLVADGVEKKLRTEESAHMELERELEQLALAAVDDDAAFKRYQDKKTEVGKSHERVALLLAAHKAALARDQETLRRHHAELHRTQLMNLRREARKVSEHGAKAFGELLPAFIDAVNKTIAAAQKVIDLAEIAKVPIPLEGSGMSRGEILRLIRSEFFRHTAREGQSDWPAASSPDVNYDWQPAAIPTATALIEQAVTRIIEQLEK